MGKGIKTAGFAAPAASAALEPFQYETKAIGPKDVHIKTKFAGICHSDIHMARDDWKMSFFPMVPGHEIAGIVEAVGPEVTKYKKGDRVGVGCLVGSCRTCENCVADYENYCPKTILTYGSKYPDGTVTYGGYGRDIVVDEHFVCKIPDNLGLDVAAPLLCAGITTYSPIRHFGGDKPGTRAAVVGLGGLGHMAVQILKAFGAKVTVISRTYAKKDDAFKRFGVDGFIAVSDEAAMKAAEGSFDFILDTVSAEKDITALANLLDVDGHLVTVGAPEVTFKMSLSPSQLIFQRKSISGSMIGGLKETQEMLDFCGKHDIKCEIEKIPMNYVNEAYSRVIKGDVKYRFVIDVESSAPVVE